MSDRRLTIDVRARELALGHYLHDASSHNRRSFRLDGKVVDALTFARHVVLKLGLREAEKTVYTQLNIFLRDRFPIKREGSRAFRGRRATGEGHYPRPRKEEAA